MECNPVSGFRSSDLLLEDKEKKKLLPIDLAKIQSAPIEALEIGWPIPPRRRRARKAGYVSNVFAWARW